MRDRYTISDFIIPNSEEHEKNLIASIMNEPMFFGDIIRMVKADMFSSEKCRKVWDILVDMYYNHEEISMMTMYPKVEQSFMVNEIVPCVGKYDSLSAMTALASSLVEVYTKRMAYYASVEALAKISNGDSVGNIVGIFDGFSRDIIDSMKDDSTKSSIDIANSLADRLMNGNILRIPTSIPSVDALTYGGFRGGQLVILAARPSVGKTTIAMQIALSASRQQIPTTLYSLEMSSEELIQRLVLGTGYIRPYEIYSNTIDWSKYEMAVAEVTNPYLFINDKSKDEEDICSKIALACQSGECKMVMIDYLTLINIAEVKGATLAQQVGKLTRRLKSLAMEYNIPIVVLSQLNRGNVGENRSPQLHDLRDSGSIEQDADIVIMLEKAKDENGEILDNTIDLWVRKNRGGRCNFDNPIRLRGNETYSNFVEVNDEY